MTKIACKGATLSVGGNVTQLLSVDFSGLEIQTYDATSLDTTTDGKQYQRTGFYEPGTWSAEVFFDPSEHATQTAFFASLTAAAALETASDPAVVIDYPNSQGGISFGTAGLSLDSSVVIEDGLKATLSGQISGDVTFAAS